MGLGRKSVHSPPLSRRGELFTAGTRVVGVPSGALASDRLVGCGRHGRAPVCGSNVRGLAATLGWGGQKQCYLGGEPLLLSSHSTVPPLERRACPRVPPVAASAVAAGCTRQWAGGAPVVEDGSLPSRRPMLMCLRRGLTLPQSCFLQGPHPSSYSLGLPTSPPSPPTRLDHPCTQEGDACCKRVPSTSALAVWNVPSRAQGLRQQEMWLLPAHSFWWSPLSRDWSSSRGCKPRTSSARIAAFQKYTPAPGGHNNSARPKFHGRSRRRPRQCVLSGDDGGYDGSAGGRRRPLLSPPRRLQDQREKRITSWTILVQQGVGD